MNIADKSHTGAMTSTNQKATVTTSASTSSTSVAWKTVASSSRPQLPPGSNGTPDLSSDFDFPHNGSTTTGNSLLSPPSSTARFSKEITSGSTLSPVALQADYDTGAESAGLIEEQIAADKKEVVYIIANYAVEPSEMLHLVDRWLQQLLGEFKQQRDYFKHRLSDKWQNEELANVTYANNDRIRKIYSAYTKLDAALNTILSREKFDELNNYLRIVDDNTTNEMKEKFNILVQQYLDILHILKEIDRETNTGSGIDDNYISEIKKNLQKLKELNNKQSHTICIVGLEKAGKSTFINALLGFTLVPTAVERCTQVRTVLKPPLGNGNQQLFATVKFYDDDEFSRFYDQMRRKTDETQQQLDDRKREVMATRETLKVKFPEEHFPINNWNDVDRERKVIGEQLCAYITGEVYVNIIKEIAIYTDRLPGKNYELLDVPGFDSPIKEHRDAGLEAIKVADAFLFLTSGQQPSLTQPQVRLLHEIQENHFEAMHRAFGIVTKLDLCQTRATYQDHYVKARDELIEKKFKAENIYVACPRLYTIEKDSHEHRVIVDKLHDFGNDIAQGFERSKEALNKFIEYELPKTHLKQLVELGRMRLAPLVLERLNRIKEKQILPRDLADMSRFEDYIKQQRIENWDQVYDEHIFKPAFVNANHWHATIITKERAKFIDDVRQTFHSSFLDRTKTFLQSTYQIEQIMFEKYGYSVLQPNAHPTDNAIREILSFALEKIVDETSDVLAQHFYHRYICGLENILNDVCPHLKDLYHPKLTLEKCTNETHALILRVCRPIITAILRYSHFDSSVKMHAINELIYIAPTVAYNIANSLDQSGSSGIAGMDIHKSVKLLTGKSELATSIIRRLFASDKD